MRLATFKKFTVLIIIISLIYSTVSIVLAMGVAAASNRELYVNPLIKSEQEMRMTGHLVGELSNDIELLGVTVIPHIRSNNVEYERKDYNSAKPDIGALLNIYIKNQSSEAITPAVTFNGKTATQHIISNNHSVSWANTPDTRGDRRFDKERLNKDGSISQELSDFIPLSTEIMPNAVDCYSINVTDGKLLYDGLEMVITANGKSATATLYADHPFLNVYRIMWTSSENRASKPDGFMFYLDNKSSQPATINNVRIYDGTDIYYEHYWNQSVKDYNVTYNQGGIIKANEVNYGVVNFNDIVPTQEYLVELNVTHMGRTYNIIHKTRPIVYEYDVAVGWASSDVVNETYLKAITSMHFNSVIYNINDGYMQLPENIKEKYPIKLFGGGAEHFTFGDEYIPNNPETQENDMVIRIEDIHAALPFGEPQLEDTQERYQPMRCFNKLAMYRNIPLATNITLTHEPAYYRFAGLSDLIHYDAYRINAPFSDNWLAYYPYLRENKFGWWYASPLETMGDYMRTMNSQFYPNRTAAWTQGAKTWNIVRRLSRTEQYRYTPNPYELRMQAFLNVANGANSLYWFNIKSGDLLYNRDSSFEMWKVNREFAIIKDYLTYQVPYYHNRADNYDLNSTIGTDYAILYVSDLNYRLSKSEYKYNGVREDKSFSIKVPEYLHGLNTLVKIDESGVKNMQYELADGYVTFTDSVDMTGLYMFVNSEELATLQDNYTSVKEREIFNYFENEADLAELRALVGVKDGETYRPDSVIKENRIFAVVQLSLLGATIVIVALAIMLRKRKFARLGKDYYDI